MKPWPRTRKCVKWGGAVVTVLLVAAWVGSGWCLVGWRWFIDPNEKRGPAAVGVDEGSLMLIFDDTLAGPMFPEGWQVETHPFQFRFGVHWSHVPGHAFIILPLWPAVLTAVAVTGSAWVLDVRVRRRALAGACPGCGYSRAGLPYDTLCPECGVSPGRRG